MAEHVRPKRFLFVSRLCALPFPVSVCERRTRKPPAPNGTGAQNISFVLSFPQCTAQSPREREGRRQRKKERRGEIKREREGKKGRERDHSDTLFRAVAPDCVVNV